MTILELTKQLIELRKEIAEKDKAYEDEVSPLKKERDAVQASILQALTESDMFSARFDFATVTKAVRKTLKVVDEPTLVAHLKASGLGEYVKETVNELFDGVKKDAIKNGVELPGCEVKETEYISLTEAKSDNDRRKVAQ